MFPVMRWVALAWVAVWLPAYWISYGWRNFLQFCDVAVILTCLGLWLDSALILSSQALSVLLVNMLWVVDVGGRLVSGHHPIGGTQYMWNPGFPLWIRLLSLFHLVWPVLLVWAVRRAGYDRRALLLQIGIAVVVFTLTRAFADAAKNPNFAFRDPFFKRSWAPAPLHVALSVDFMAVFVYWPTHAVLTRLYGRRKLDSPR